MGDSPTERYLEWLMRQHPIVVTIVTIGWIVAGLCVFFTKGSYLALFFIVIFTLSIFVGWIGLLFVACAWSDWYYKRRDE